ncbi:competence/damage-inducible protein A [Jeotgalibacillus soli]|uniref:Putative competence-damage inducible protein n=1 Tax=Jeotgalibacillus soli TaxID=889306 RepID=A0A0C2R3X2_9BACL|nr:competence/damage-inducible protein A [Jeotgalibacillus soli]KIL44955.1 damage-inducible protein [Jeotgalibacillus soli]
MNAEIIAVGSELLLGQIANTNAQFLSGRLAEIGIDVYRHRVIGDNADRLEEEITEAEKRSDIVILTGGLGPTKDDLTKETVAKYLGRKLVMDEPSLKAIEEFFIKAGREMSVNNRKQAIVIEGSTVFFNRHGMAPGMFIKTESTCFVLLPGPPREMKPMFLEDVTPVLLNELGAGQPVVSRVLRFFGIGEAELETRIEDLIDTQKNPTIAPLASDGEVTLRLSAKHAVEGEAWQLIEDTEQLILARVGQHLYGINEETLVNKAAELLQRESKTIAAAESLTAGLFASELGAIAGVSSVLKGGVVCYTNESKRDVIGVPQSILDTEGAVSERCAIEMAERIKQQFNANIGISFTGVAGPNSLEGHPPGTVWIGLSIDDYPSTALMLSLRGERNYARIRAVKHGLFQLIRSLEKK